MTQEITDVSEKFFGLISAHLGPDVMAEVKALNQKYDIEFGGAVCATHDFCDTTQFLIGALCEVRGIADAFDFIPDEEAFHVMSEAYNAVSDRFR